MTALCWVVAPTLSASLMSGIWVLTLFSKGEFTDVTKLEDFE